MDTMVDLLDGVQEAIAALPGVSIDLFRDGVDWAGRRVDRLLVAKIKGRPVHLIIEAQTGGYPRDVRSAAAQLALLKQGPSPPPVVPILAAPAISETSRELLKKEGIGFWDTGGSLYLEVPWAIFWIERPVPRGGSRRLQNLFKGSSTQVLHALLLEPQRAWHVQDLAERAQVSPSTAHQVLVYLEEQLWVEKQGKGPAVVRVLRAPGDLLDAWAAKHTLESYQASRFHRWSRRTDDLVEPVTAALEQARAVYALTLGSGAQLVAPFATEAGRLAVLVPSSLKLDALTHDIGLKPVDEGENVLFLQAQIPTPLLFRQRAGGAWVASDVQLYLDLWAWPQRGKEQARHLRRERLGY